MARRTGGAAASGTDESKADRFIRLARARTAKALSAIRSLRPLVARQSYEYTKEQWTRITLALSDELDHLNSAVDSGTYRDGLFDL